MTSTGQALTWPQQQKARKLFIDGLDDCFLSKHIAQPTRSSSDATPDLVITGIPEDTDVLENFASSDHYMQKWTTVLSVQQIEYNGILKDFSTPDWIKHTLE